MKIHLVKRSDTLFGIAKKHGVGLEQLIAANPQISDPDRLEDGAKVRIPSVPRPVPQPQVEYKHQHTVSQGDTLWKISKAWDIPLKLLIDANPHLKNPSVLLTGDTVYIPKVKADGGMITMDKNDFTAPTGKASTAPKMNNATKAELTAPKAEQTAPKKPNQPIEAAPVAPIEENPVAPIAEKPVAPIAEKPVAPIAEKPVAPIAEKPVAPIAENPVAPIVEKPMAPIAENPVAPIAEKPMAPIAEKPVAPIAEKPMAPIAEKPVAPIAEKPMAPITDMPMAPIAEMPFVPMAHMPENSNPMPILQGMQEAVKSNMPPVAAPLSYLPNLAPVVEATKDMMKPICPQLPEFQNPYAHYSQIPVSPHYGAYPYDFQTQHPFDQYPVQAVEAMASNYPNWGTPGEMDCYQQEQPLWPSAVSPYAQSADPYGTPGGYDGMGAPWVEKDCGCGGGQLNLPYAWVPQGNETPMVQGMIEMQNNAGPNQQPLQGAPNAAPYLTAPYGWQTTHASECQPEAIMPQMYHPQMCHPQMYQPQGLEAQMYQPQGFEAQMYQPQGFEAQMYQPEMYQPQGYQPMYPQQEYQPQGYQPEMYQPMMHQPMMHQPMAQQPMMQQPMAQQPMENSGFPGYQGTQSWMGQSDGQPGFAGDGTEDLPTYSTAYANPYTFPSFAPGQAPHEAGINEEMSGEGMGNSQVQSAARANKQAAARNVSKPREERTPLQVFLERQRTGGYTAEPRNSRPWINL